MDADKDSSYPSNHLLYYYIAKRSFLFLDEWLFYGILYYLFKTKYYKAFAAVLLYGSGCIYTSYTNISRIERHIIDEEQEFYALKMCQDAFKTYVLRRT